MAEKESNLVVWGVGSGILIILLISLAIWLPPVDKSPNDNLIQKTNRTSPTSEDQVIQEQPEEIYRSYYKLILYDYENNELSANKKYEGKIYEITGIVDSVSQDIFGTPYIVLRDEYEISGVQCLFKSEDDLLSLRKGQMVRVKGRISGYILGSVIVEDCSLE